MNTLRLVTILTACLVACALSVFGPSAAQSVQEKAANVRVWEKASAYRYLVVIPKGAPLKDAQLTPGYYDADTNTLYCWKAVAFPAALCPYSSPYNSVIGLDPTETKFNIMQYDPDVYYLKLESKKVAPGYFGLGRKDFHRWKNIVIEAEEIPEDVVKQANRVLDVASYKRPIIDVEPPKHLVEKPELWKKVKK